MIAEYAPTVAEAIKWTDVGIFGATVLLAIVTGALFVATYLVARRTAELAADQAATNRLLDQHHQESLMPWCDFFGVDFVVEDVDLDVEGGTSETKIDKPRTSVCLTCSLGVN
jgi:hypothetical protein